MQVRILDVSEVDQNLAEGAALRFLNREALVDLFAIDLPHLDEDSAQRTAAIARCLALRCNCGHDETLPHSGRSLFLAFFVLDDGFDIADQRIARLVQLADRFQFVLQLAGLSRAVQHVGRVDRAAFVKLPQVIV